MGGCTSILLGTEGQLWREEVEEKRKKSCSQSLIPEANFFT